VILQHATFVTKHYCFDREERRVSEIGAERESETEREKVSKERGVSKVTEESETKIFDRDKKS